MPAKIFFEGRLHKKVYLTELSTTGLSFNIKESDYLPDLFELRFRLRPFSKVIKIQMEVKNRRGIPGGLRIGCRFLKLSDEDKELINNYVCRYVDLSGPLRLIDIAAFLLSIDALWRILAYLVNFYYGGTEFGKSFQTSSGQDFYGIVLVLYAIFSFAAFISTDNIFDRRGKTRFLLRLFCLVAAFVFIVTKNISYCKLHIWHSDYLFINAFLWTQIFLVFYTGFSIAVVIASLKKINLVLDIIGLHRWGLSQRM
ncbi:MAG: PilZ domain-containing protein [Candidatus Omnitrophica bacterium]|nr:PilZ domain-containing protein [Candidatus Omnitrophota bacterium]